MYLWVLRQQEGQFFERKSCFDHSKRVVKLRPVRDVARDVAETLAAMANADGGTLVLGVEDDGTVSGADYPEDRLKVLRAAAKTHIRPPVRVRIVREREPVRRISDTIEKEAEEMPLSIQTVKNTEISG